MQFRVTVIIPVYNMQKYLKTCLESIVNQTLDGLEIIAINDGSTDNSLDILNEYAAKYSNIYIYTQRNQGQAVAKNYGISNARGKYILFMDPDDYYPHNECIQKMYELSQKGNFDIYGGIMLDDNNGSMETTDKNIADTFFTNRIVNMHEYPDIYHHQRFMFKKEFLKKNSIFFPAYKRYEDPPFTLKALCIAKKFYATDIEVYVHRIGYKKTQYPIDVCIDVLSGIRDVVRICLDNHIDILYSKLLYRISKDYTVPIYKYLYCGFEEIDTIVKEIFGMLNKWERRNDISRERVSLLKKDSIEEYEQVKRILMGKNKIILYGAGGITKIFIDLYSKYTSNIIGLAVSKNAKKINFEGYEVKEISEYKGFCKEAIVIITTLEKYQNEIKIHLTELGFDNILVPDISGLRLAEAILDE